MSEVPLYPHSGFQRDFLNYPDVDNLQALRGLCPYEPSFVPGIAGDIAGDMPKTYVPAIPET